MWAHPDLMPTAEDLDDPEGFVRGRPELDITDLDAGEPGGPPQAEGTQGPEETQGPPGPEGTQGPEGPEGTQGPQG
jgi:hypothetical protein